MVTTAFLVCQDSVNKSFSLGKEVIFPRYPNAFLAVPSFATHAAVELNFLVLPSHT